ncbi:Glutamate synthase domain-containing protein 1 [Mesorhizobium albiziae]|uniref:glutamine--fructose-6-phosphate transaminase (isomerizing) n=1 Tax=Neomesorhizobium albiziae TaxID=335020 RepID=A0A1I4D8F0_9HYPH|nr:glutamine amidotransferase family protein [Mesorhizobium albiziae]GLS33571.1 glutamine amidotransferase [Mesorhizobium albiziae]SFK89792.1 Glutamate synthase domain-containing protein 1 [Mesorhizobium albiziae]
MCGIVGLFLKDKSLEPELGSMLSEMLVLLTDRGPDSAGIAIYGAAEKGRAKITIQSPAPSSDFPKLEADLSKEIGAKAKVTVKSTHAVIDVPTRNAEEARAAVLRLRPNVRIMGSGDVVEIYKEVGLPEAVVKRFDVQAMSGTHGIGHTRMATESAVTTMGAHPFSTGPDQCLVHNGSLSNHNNLRRELIRDGMSFETENDTEVAAAYLSSKIAHGMNLGEALESGLNDLDGFYTFVVGTKNGFGVVRDPIACKPAVLAETDRYVAFGSEYRALANLPGIADAKVWEPEPSTVYFWEH